MYICRIVLLLGSFFTSSSRSCSFASIVIVLTIFNVVMMYTMPIKFAVRSRSLADAALVHTVEVYVYVNLTISTLRPQPKTF